MHFNMIDNALSDFEAAVRCDGHHLAARLQIAAHHHGLGDMEAAATAGRPFSASMRTITWPRHVCKSARKT